MASVEKDGETTADTGVLKEMKRTRTEEMPWEHGVEKRLCSTIQAALVLPSAAFGAKGLASKTKTPCHYQFLLGDVDLRQSRPRAAKLLQSMVRP